MSFYMEDFKDDALKISDEQVTADWRFGLLRSVAQVVAGGAAPLDSTGRFGMAIAGSNREHVKGGYYSGETRMGFCPLVEIYDVKEEQGERYNFSTFGSTSDDVMLLKANATCQCGHVQRHPVSMEVEPGELIRMVMNVE